MSEVKSTHISRPQAKSASQSAAPDSHPVALAIAGFDPSSGAGITADLKTFAAHTIYGLSCITALTVQSTAGVRKVLPVDSGMVRETLQCLEDDIEIAGIKIGMLGSPAVAEAVADFLVESKVRRENVVLDPVLRSTSGAALLDAAGIRVMQQRLLALAGWITPNLDELGQLLCSPGGDTDDTQAVPQEGVTRTSVPQQAQLLRQRAAQLGNHDLHIVVTGGHLDRPDDYFLGPGSGQGIWLCGERVETTSTHGTGCAFSSALASQLLLGATGVEAVKAAKNYVSEALRQAYPVGRGRGPMHHLYRLRLPR